MTLEREKCPWVAIQTLKMVIKELRDELLELEHEIETNNKKNIPGELADTFSDIMLLIHIAERDGHIKNRNEIVQLAYDKKIRRKGWILEGKTLNWDESSAYYQKAKNLEN